MRAGVERWQGCETGWLQPGVWVCEMELSNRRSDEDGRGTARPSPEFMRAEGILPVIGEEAGIEACPLALRRCYKEGCLGCA